MDARQIDQDIIEVHHGLTSLLFPIMFCLVFILITPIAFLIGGQVPHLTCEYTTAKQNHCQFTRTLLGIKVYSTAFDNLQGASVIPKRAPKSRTHYEVHLQIARMRESLIVYDTREATDAVLMQQQITRFATTNNAPPLKIEVPWTDLGPMFLSGFAFFGSGWLFIVLVLKGLTCWTFDRKKGTMRQWQPVLGTRGKEYALTAFTAVELRTEIEHTKSSSYENFSIILHMATGKELLMIMDRNGETCEVIVDILQEFLHLPGV